VDEVTDVDEASGVAVTTTTAGVAGSVAEGDRKAGSVHVQPSRIRVNKAIPIRIRRSRDALMGYLLSLVRSGAQPVNHRPDPRLCSIAN
jgi:hypothetical protein